MLCDPMTDFIWRNGGEKTKAHKRRYGLNDLKREKDKQLATTADLYKKEPLKVIEDDRSCTS